MKRFLFCILIPLALCASPKRALVAGGAGFLGSHLCDRLIDQGYEVLCIDNLYTGSIRNIEHLMNHPRFSFLELDISHPLPGDIAADEIFNLACPASPIRYQKSPVQTIRTCVLGTMHLLELASRCKAKIFQASTSEVYGDPLEHPQKESYWGNVNPIGIRACYDEGKRCAETLCFDYHREFGVAIKVARIFNTYGPRMRPDDGRVISNFIVQALNEDPITIYGKGEQTRSFCYVSDLIEAILKFMASPEDFTGPVNLGNPSERTMLDLAQKVIAFTGSKSPLVFRPLLKTIRKCGFPIFLSPKKHSIGRRSYLSTKGCKRRSNTFKMRLFTKKQVNNSRLKLMKDFYLSYCERKKLTSLLAEISWTHHL